MTSSFWINGAYGLTFIALAWIALKVIEKASKYPLKKEEEEETEEEE